MQAPEVPKRFRAPVSKALMLVTKLLVGRLATVELRHYITSAENHRKDPLLWTERTEISKSA